VSAGSFLLILFAAMLHASWNFFTKKSTANKTAILWVGWIIAGFSMLPFALFTVDLSKASLNWIPYLLLTGIIHLLYLYLLGHSYSIGEMSLIYPISRGLSIMLTVFIVLVSGIDVISVNGSIGVLILSSGILLVAVKRVRDLEKREAMIAASKVGICISLYSILDKLSVQIIPPFFYITMMFVITSTLMIPIMFTKFKTQTILVIKRYKIYSGLIGIVSFFTYLLILFALKDSPTPYVVALRETSIVFGSILGIWVLKEEKNTRKLIGIVMIMIGAVVIKSS
jgi:uncharacterized membrane protein